MELFIGTLIFLSVIATVAMALRRSPPTGRQAGKTIPSDREPGPIPRRRPVIGPGSILNWILIGAAGAVGGVVGSTGMYVIAEEVGVFRRVDPVASEGIIYCCPMTLLLGPIAGVLVWKLGARYFHVSGGLAGVIGFLAGLVSGMALILVFLVLTIES